MTKAATSQHSNSLPAVRERIFLRLGENGGQGADDHQWILYGRASRKIPRAPWQGFDWNAVSLVRSTKTVLERIIREKGLDPFAESRAALDRSRIAPGRATTRRASSSTPAASTPAGATNSAARSSRCSSVLPQNRYHSLPFPVLTQRELTGQSRTWSARCSSPSGPAKVGSVIRRSRVCGRTSAPRTWCGRAQRNSTLYGSISKRRTPVLSP